MFQDLRLHEHWTSSPASSLSTNWNCKTSSQLLMLIHILRWQWCPIKIVRPLASHLGWRQRHLFWHCHCRSKPDNDDNEQDEMTMTMPMTMVNWNYLSVERDMPPVKIRRSTGKVSTRGSKASVQAAPVQPQHFACKIFYHIISFANNKVDFSFQIWNSFSWSFFHLTQDAWLGPYLWILPDRQCLGMHQGL